MPSPTRWAGSNRVASRWSWCRSRDRPIASNMWGRARCFMPHRPSSRSHHSVRKASSPRSSTPLTKATFTGLPVARALAADLGLDPAKDVNIVVVGEGAQAAALVRTKQVDVLSLYDTQYALIENA